ncbi:MAG: hypothetical protein E7467_06235 [Ruminococcaceae bacterium]|nr:hypothetical protein [Oscillospiraceae bacterium]
MKRYFLFFLCIALLLPLFCPTTPQTQAASTYDPYKAIAYAEANWNSGKGLCAEFVWNCLKAGGLNLSTSGLQESPYVTTGLAEAACRAIGKPYTGVKDFPLLVTDNRFGPTHAYNQHPNNNAVTIGDLLFVYCETCGKTPHVVICSGYGNGSLLCVYGHNYAQQNSFSLPAGANEGGHVGHQFSMRYLDLSNAEEYNCECSVLFDVDKAAWYHEYVHEVLNKGLMSGVSEYRFDPEGSMTRAMVVTVLYRYNYEPQAKAPTFSDIEPYQWYTNAVSWAAENGIVGGVGNNRFDPSGNVTREQLAAILYRYTASMGNDCSAAADLSAFSDAVKVSPWAREAMQWAVAEGLINGSDGKLLPGGFATRTQVAAILIRYIEKFGVIATSGACGDNATWSLSCDGTMTISGQGAMWDNFSDYPEGEHWYKQANFIRSLIVEDGVSTLSGLTEVLPSLQEVRMADSVEQLGTYSFMDAPNLHTVRLSKFLTEIPNGCFNGCAKLTSVELPDSLKKIHGDAFKGCSSLQRLTLPGSLVYIGPNAFADCSSLQEIQLPEGLKELAADAFCNCTALNSLKIPASVENIFTEEDYNLYQNFFPCRIEVDDSNHFYCSDKDGILYSKDQTTLLYANEALCGSFTIPETVKKIGDYAFSGCRNLTSVTVHEQVRSIGIYAFMDCGSMQSIKLPKTVDQFGHGVFYQCTKLKRVDLPEGANDLYDMFNFCISLEQVTLPKGLTKLDSYAFNECYSLKSFVVPEEVSVVRYQDWRNCYQLRNIYFLGDAPEEFNAGGGRITLRYIAGKNGWTSPSWHGYPTATWEP